MSIFWGEVQFFFTVIIKISEPLIRKFPNRKRTTVIIDMAVAAWNMSLVSEDIRENTENKIVKILPKAVDAMGVALIVEQIEI